MSDVQPVGTHETDGPDFSYYVVCDDCDHVMGWAKLDEARIDKRNHQTVNPHRATIKHGEKSQFPEVRK